MNITSLKTKLVISSAIVGLSTSLLHVPFVYSTGQGNCESGYIHKDESSPFTYSGTSIITKVIVKAGSAQSTNGNQCVEMNSNGSNGCYEVSGLGTTSVTISKVGSGSSCKDISHAEFYTSTVTPTVEPTATPTATPTNIPVQPTTTPIPTDTESITPTPSDRQSNQNPTSTPAPTKQPDPTATPTNIPNIGGTEVASVQTEGQILSASTLADTGTFDSLLAQSMSILGSISTIFAIYGYHKAKKSVV